MFKKKLFYVVSLLLALSLSGAAFAPAMAAESPKGLMQEGQSIVDIAVSDGRFETLVAALGAAELAETLAGEGPFTVFAPTDAAFEKLPQGTVQSLLNDIPTLTNILLYHVVSGEVYAEDVAQLEEAETLSGDAVSVRFNEGNILIKGGKVFINDAQVVIADIQASNGVIHVIDSVLLPPEAEEEAMGSIVDIAVADGRFETLVAALGAAELAETLAGEGPFTVFAPTDDAFGKLPEGTVESLLNDIPALTDILLYHVVSGEVLAEDVVQLESAETLLGENVAIRVEDGNVYLNDAMVVITDIVADNGVIHVIDSVLLPPQEEESMGSIVDIAVADGRFETLVAALGAAELAETLAGEGPFTVFAPTDDAFGKLPEGTVESLLNDIPALTDILLYHVVSGEVLAEDVVQLESAETLLGESVAIRVEGGNVYLNDAMVIITDIMADNGVIHVIDSVLLPPQEEELPSNSIVDIAVADGRFETLVAALGAADLAETLAGEGPFTVFAPTDAAFEKLPEGTVQSLLNDIPALTDILLYHVVSGEVLAEDALALGEAETLLGESVSIRFDEGNILIPGGKVFINESEVLIADIQADNGVIHVIDSVLLP